MDAADAQRNRGIVIAPMGIGEVLDTGFSLARRHFRLLALTTAWGIVPAYVVSALLTLAASATTIVGLLVGLLAGLLEMIPAFLVDIPIAIACARLVEPTGGPDELEASALYRAAWRRLGHYVLWLIVVGVLAIPLAILFPFGIYVLIRWSLAWIALAVEGVGPTAALGRSWDLTRRAWWHTLVVGAAVGIVVGILGVVIAGIFGAASALVAIAGSGALGALVNTLGSALSVIILTPFWVAIYVILYYELRARNEGFDLEQRARQVAPAT